MSGTQSYIGTPNGVVLCVDEKADGVVSGRLYHAATEEGIPFQSLEAAVMRIEAYYNSIEFPYPATNLRLFKGTESKTQRKKEERRIPDEELLKKRGAYDTFIIRVQQNQYSCWQGRISWVERDVTQNFDTVSQMMDCLERAILANQPAAANTFKRR